METNQPFCFALKSHDKHFLAKDPYSKLQLKTLEKEFSKFFAPNYSAVASTEITIFIDTVLITLFRLLENKYFAGGSRMM